MVWIFRGLFAHYAPMRTQDASLSKLFLVNTLLCRSTHVFFFYLRYPISIPNLLSDWRVENMRLVWLQSCKALRRGVDANLPPVLMVSSVKVYRCWPLQHIEEKLLLVKQMYWRLREDPIRPVPFSVPERDIDKIVQSTLREALTNSC